MKTNKIGKVSFSAAKRNLLNSLILAALVVPGMAMAEDMETTRHKEGQHVIPESAHTVSANVAFVTDYLFRGISQTGTKPAIQGGMDYAHESGLYAGAWGSNISWLSDYGTAANASFELDTYIGFGSSITEDVSYDVGVLRYNYPGEYGTNTKADTNEVYGSIGWKWLTAKYSYSLGDTFGISEAKGTSYIEVGASYELPDTGINIGVHYGKQTYKGATADALAADITTTPGVSQDPSFSDYNLSVSKEFSGFELGLTYSKTDAKSGGWYSDPQGNDLGKGKAVLSVSRSM